MPAYIKKITLIELLDKQISDYINEKKALESKINTLDKRIKEFQKRRVKAFASIH